MKFLFSRPSIVEPVISPSIVEPIISNTVADAGDRISNLRTELDRLDFGKQSSEDGGISTPEPGFEVDEVLSSDDLRYFDPFAVQNSQNNAKDSSVGRQSETNSSAATNSWLLSSLNQLKSDESSLNQLKSDESSSNQLKSDESSSARKSNLN